MQIDAGFKVDADGMTTVMSGEGYILAIWIGTSALKGQLSPFLKAVGEKSKALGLVGLHLSMQVR